MNRRFPARGIAVALIGLAITCIGADKPDAKPADSGAPWQSLFDGKTLGKWKSTEFGGQGESTVENGTLMLVHGEPMTGVTWQGEPPMKMNYEIEFDAQRVDGSDFFVGLTFPVNKDNASLIMGGWGGALCGISNLDDNDAANNETTKLHEFKNKQWYHIRLRVEPEKFQAWLDDEQLINVSTKDKKIGIRFEVELSKPFGFACYQSSAALKNIQWRPLGPTTNPAK